MTAVVGWKISSSYWLDESRCVVLVGRLIWDFVSNILHLILVHINQIKTLPHMKVKSFHKLFFIR